MDCGPLKYGISPDTGRVSYRGRALGRAARIAAHVASSGQVLCSGPAWEAAQRSELVEVRMGMGMGMGAAGVCVWQSELESAAEYLCEGPWTVDVCVTSTHLPSPSSPHINLFAHVL